MAQPRVTNRLEAGVVRGAAPGDERVISNGILGGLLSLYAGTVTLTPRLRSRQSRLRNTLQRLPRCGGVFRKLYEREPHTWWRIWAVIVIGMATVLVLTGLTVTISPKAVK